MWSDHQNSIHIKKTNKQKSKKTPQLSTLNFSTSNCENENRKKSLSTLTFVESAAFWKLVL